MTINDVALNEHCLELRQLTDELQIYMREGNVQKLQRTIDRIGEHWMQAGYRLNDLRYTARKA